jgi:hypothetical protein
VRPLSSFLFPPLLRADSSSCPIPLLLPFPFLPIIGLALIVGRPTFNQSLKGILSAGPVKSLRYVWPKLKKKWGAATASPAAIKAPAKIEEITEEGEKKQ